MSRPIRIEFPDALCHVTARGDRREKLEQFPGQRGFGDCRPLGLPLILETAVQSASMIARAKLSARIELFHQITQIPADLQSLTFITPVTHQVTAY